jgi:hypothetical protein
MALPSFPWRLRISHEGLRSLKLERPGRRLRVDPIAPIDADDILVLTGSWPEQLEAAAALVRSGARPAVVAAPEVLAYLASLGPVQAFPGPVSIDGLAIELQPYTPIPWMSPAEAPGKLISAAVRPDRALARLGRRARLPRAAPRAFQLTLPDGGRLVYLGTALHSGTPPDWFEKIRAEWRAPQWLVVGVDLGEEAAAAELIPQMNAEQVILTDLVSEVRRAMGLKIGLLTPLGDTLIERGLAAQVLVSGAGLRYERAPAGAGGH